MPKQLLFYMSRGDEHRFLEFLRASSRIAVLPATSSIPEFTPIDTLPEAFQDEATRKFWLQNMSVNLPIVTELNEKLGQYLINGFQSPVVEFLRSFTVSNIMLPGRLEADLNYFDEDTRDLAPKPIEFRNWYESIEAWIKKNYRHLTFLTYVGPGAEKFREDGGLLH